MKLNCLIYDTKLKNDISLYMRVFAADAAKSGTTAFFPDMYADLKDNGVEIDMESTGFLYNQLFGDKKIDMFTTSEDVEDMVGATMKSAVNNTADAILREDPEVALALARMFDKNMLNDIPEKEVTAIRQMQDIVKKAALSLLPKEVKTKSSTLHGALQDYFSSYAVAFERLDGGINTMRTLWDAAKVELDNYVEAVASKLDDNQALVFREQWAQYMNSFKDASYSLMLGKGNTNELLNESLKQIRIDGVQLTDNQGNVNWDAVIEHGNSDIIYDKVYDALQQGFQDKDGNTVKYNRYQSDVIANYIKRAYEKKLVAVKQQKLANERTRMQSAKNIISDFLKDEGYVSLVKDKNGKLLLTKADWTEFKKMIIRSGKESGIDAAVEKFRQFIETKTDSKGNLLFDTDVQKDQAVKSFREALVSKFIPTTATPNNIERLIAYKNLNNGNAFRKRTAAALNKLAGVSELSQKAIDRINDLTEAAERIYGNVVSSSVSPNQDINIGSFAFQALAQIDREIKKVLREHMVDASTAQALAKSFADVLNSASSTLLLNPSNFSENPLTGFGSNIGESIKQLFISPKLFFKQFPNNQKAFWTAFLSYAFGGADNKIINELDLEIDLPAGERKRFRELGDIFRRDTSTWSKIRKGLGIPVTVVNTTMRFLFNSFDAGFNSAYMRKNMANSIYEGLINEGKTPKEAMAILDSNFFNMSDDKVQQIKSANDAIFDELKKAGLSPTIFDKKQNLMDMKMALYQDAIIQGASKVPTPLQAETITKAYIKSAQDVSRRIGGKQNIHSNNWAGIDVPLTLIYGAAKGLTALQRSAFKAQEYYEKEGKLKTAAALQVIGAISQNTIGRFAGGVANFLALSITSTPLGFITAGSLKMRQSQLKEGNDMMADPEKIRQYNQVHQMYRSIITRATLGTMGMVGVILSYLGADDDDEDESLFNNLMQTKSGRKLIARWVPMGAAIAISSLEEIEDRNYDTKMERAFDYLSQVTGKRYDTWESLKKSIGRVKEDEDYGVIAAQVLGSFFSVNLNQDEQVTKFYHTLQSGLDASYIDVVNNDEEISKNTYKDAETAMDAFLINGVFDKMMRIKKEGKSNRYRDGEE